MNFEYKGRSPFSPGQPVAPDLFIGRETEVHDLLREAHQVSLGAMRVLYITGEYSMGKSSLAGYIATQCQLMYNLVPIYTTLDGVAHTHEITQRTLQGFFNSNKYQQSIRDRVGSFLSRFGTVEALSFSLDLGAFKPERFSTHEGYLPLLQSIHEEFKSDKKGIALFMDEINGIAEQPAFAHFLKGLVDGNALSQSPIPLLLVLISSREKRAALISHYAPIERIFKPVVVGSLTNEEVKSIFTRAFQSVHVQVEPAALELLARYSQGNPKIAHEIGEEAFYHNRGTLLDVAEAQAAIASATRIFGQKYVDEQILGVIYSDAYLNILRTLAELDEPEFDSGLLAARLPEADRKKLPNFLQKMKKLDVLLQKGARGHYRFKFLLLFDYLKLKVLQG